MQQIQFQYPQTPSWPDPLRSPTRVIPLLGRKDLYPYQEAVVQHILNNPYVTHSGGAGCVVEMGLGKTVSTLTAANELIYIRRQYSKVLVIAPKRVAEHTWPKEVQKWDHLKHMRVSVIAGNAKKRQRALETPADVYTVSRDNISKLIAFFKGHWPFDFIVVDELTSFKSSDSGRFKALRTILPQTTKRIGLTGTFAPNGLIDLWAQMFILDKGARLGTSVTGYRKEYFTHKTTIDKIEYDYRIKKSQDPLLGRDFNAAKIYDRISDICISMKASDYLTLPPLVDIFESVELPHLVREQYKQFERDSVMQLHDEEITAFSAAGLYSKLLQFANGAVYDANKNYHAVHDAKIEALEEILEEANGDPVLIFYSFQSDVDRIKKKLARFKPHLLDSVADIDRWNEGKIPVMLAHPQSAGHGLNMQDGGCNLVWFGLPWSLESYLQAVARLYRQGQKRRVNNYVLTCPGTLEDDVAQSLRQKGVTQDDLMLALKYNIDERKREWGEIRAA